MNELDKMTLRPMPSDNIEDQIKHARQLGAYIGEELAKAVERGQRWESKWVLDNAPFSDDQVGECSGSVLTIKIEPRAVK